MTQRTNRELITFLTGMLCGAVCGALASIWLAPRSGEATRQEIQKIVVTLRSRAKEGVQSVVEHVPGIGSAQESTGDGDAPPVVIRSERSSNTG